MKLKEAYSFAEEVLRVQGEENPALAARLLLSGLLGRSAAEMALHSDEAFEDLMQERANQGYHALQDALKRREMGEPLQYIIGKAPFRHIELVVRPGALIPRPETEVLVDLVKEYLVGMRGIEANTKQNAKQNTNEAARILDVGTGSGCIALALLNECSNLELIATDISEEALAVAHKNAERLGLQNRLCLLKDDLATKLHSEQKNHRSFAVLVSNPPYIPTKELAALPQEVLNYEPLLALDGGEDGLDFFRRLAKQAEVVLVDGGLFACELHESTTHAAVLFLKQQNQWCSISIHTDLAGRPRFVTALCTKEEQ